MQVPAGHPGSYETEQRLLRLTEESRRAVQPRAPLTQLGQLPTIYGSFNTKYLLASSEPHSGLQTEAAGRGLPSVRSDTASDAAGTQRSSQALQVVQMPCSCSTRRAAARKERLLGKSQDAAHASPRNTTVEPEGMFVGSVPMNRYDRFLDSVFRVVLSGKIICFVASSQLDDCLRFSKQ